MPWYYQLAMSVGSAVILILINKLTTKSSAQTAQDIKELKDDIKLIKEVLPTTDNKVAAERRLTLLEAKLEELSKEVNFTKTSHTEFLRLLERALIPVAHSPHTPELDRLLEKRDRGEELTADEWEDLLRRLEEQSQFYNDMPGKKVALKGLMAIYLTQLRQVRRREDQMHLTEI